MPETCGTFGAEPAQPENTIRLLDKVVQYISAPIFVSLCGASSEWWLVNNTTLTIPFTFAARCNPSFVWENYARECVICSPNILQPKSAKIKNPPTSLDRKASSSANILYTFTQEMRSELRSLREYCSKVHAWHLYRNFVENTESCVSFSCIDVCWWNRLICYEIAFETKFSHTACGRWSFARWPCEKRIVWPVAERFQAHVRALKMLCPLAVRRSFTQPD